MQDKEIPSIPRHSTTVTFYHMVDSKNYWPPTKVTGPGIFSGMQCIESFVYVGPTCKFR